MATVRPVVLKRDRKKDRTWNIKLQIGHKGKSAYIPTEHFVTADQLRKDFTIKDKFLNEEVLPMVVAGYRKRISSIGIRLESMTAKDIKAELLKRDVPEVINFSEFCQEHIASLRGNGKDSSADNMQTVFNSITDFFQSDSIMASDITALKLREYETYLRGRRVMYRENQFGKVVKIVRPGMGSGVHNYMRDLRLMFNAARDKFNDEDNGIMRIPHYPFRKYKVQDPPAPEKRNLTIDQVRLIRDSKAKPGGRAELARDLFMLSFYLCGINSVDLFKLTKPHHKGRVEYFRSKTEGRRKDRAFISIKAINQAVPLLEKYAGKLSERYADHDALNKAINLGLKQVLKAVNAKLSEDSVKFKDENLLDLKISDLTFYYARHTFGDTARNKCRFSKDDVALALNHVDQGRKTTDTYIAPDWKIVDELQQAVVGLL